MKIPQRGQHAAGTDLHWLALRGFDDPLKHMTEEL